MGVIKAMRGPVVVLALFLLTLYLPFAATVYTPYWYTAHCSWDTDCRFAEHFEPGEAASTVTAFLRHQDELGGLFPVEELAALSAIRDALDGFFMAAIAAFLLVLVLFSRERIATAARFNLVAIPVVVVMSGLSFSTFWVSGILPLISPDLPMAAHEASVMPLIMHSGVFLYALWLTGLLAFLINLGLAWQVKPRRRSIFR